MTILGALAAIVDQSWLLLIKSLPCSWTRTQPNSDILFNAKDF